MILWMAECSIIKRDFHHRTSSVEDSHLKKIHHLVPYETPEIKKVKKK